MQSFLEVGSAVKLNLAMDSDQQHLVVGTAMYWLFPDPLCTSQDLLCMCLGLVCQDAC